jgi:hypothetical protein
MIGERLSGIKIDTAFPVRRLSALGALDAQ